MKNHFVFKLPLLAVLFLTAAAFTVELGRPVAPCIEATDKGGTQSLFEKKRLFSQPVIAPSDFTVQGGNISFISQTPINTITATNRSIRGALDSKTGAVEIWFEMNQFVFPQRLMREHFNSDFVHSDQYPLAGFSGKIKQVERLASDGKHEVTVEGQITLHGVTQPLNVRGIIEKNGKNMYATYRFPLKPEDFGISVPQILRVKIAEKVEVSVDLNLQQPEGQ